MTGTPYPAITEAKMRFLIGKETNWLMHLILESKVPLKSENKRCSLAWYHIKNKELQASVAKIEGYRFLHLKNSFKRSFLCGSLGDMTQRIIVCLLSYFLLYVTSSFVLLWPLRLQVFAAWKKIVLANSVFWRNRAFVCCCTRWVDNRHVPFALLFRTVFVEWGRTSAFIEAPGSRYQSIFDLTHPTQPHPDRPQHRGTLDSLHRTVCGFFNVPRRLRTLNVCETGVHGFKSLSEKTWRCNYKGSTFSSVIFKGPWVLF